ncbi:exostosin family protein [Actinidia rufa]|uniref:Exostosin family protein n=1 Tax=Actinidia rufa TaxID=165716 RepID=A0A7J0GC20_9ERIC|nr:exostosin family protein [Actinidia rufa]
MPTLLKASNQPRDVSLPEIKIPSNHLGPPHLGQPPNNRSILAFFAGGDHGHVRKNLLKYWKDKDDDIQVHDYLPKTLNYFELMGRAKYCLCASGYEVASPRVVESIYAECVSGDYFRELRYYRLAMFLIGVNFQSMFRCGRYQRSRVFC